jgi:hypothetical protein
LYRLSNFIFRIQKVFFNCSIKIYSKIDILNFKEDVQLQNNIPKIDTMSSNLESFQTQIQSLIGNLVITPLVAWLQTEKKITVSAEELFDVLRIPRIQKPLTVIPPNPSQPPIPLSTIGLNPVPETKKVARPKSKSSQPTLDNYSGPTCKYVFKRGENKGQSCGKPVVSGGEFCEQCNNKKSSTTSSKSTTESAPKAEAKPVGFTTTNVAKRAELNKGKIKIELRETGQPNTYVDTQTNIVVKKVVDKENTIYVAVGVQEETGFRTLTEDEKKEALNRNFSLQTSTPETKEPKPADKKIVAKQPVSSIPDIESDTE